MKEGISMRTYKIALLPGDCVGKEVVPEGVKVLQEMSRVTDTFKLVFDEFPWGAEFYLKHGQCMPDDALDILKKYDAIYLGAIGHPDVPDHIGVGQVIFTIRQNFNQYVNLRPIKLLPGIECPLRNKGVGDIDMLFIRENTEGGVRRHRRDIYGPHLPGDGAANQHFHPVRHRAGYALRFRAGQQKNG